MKKIKLNCHYTVKLLTNTPQQVAILVQVTVNEPNSSSPGFQCGGD